MEIDLVGSIELFGSRDLVSTLHSVSIVHCCVSTNDSSYSDMHWEERQMRGEDLVSNRDEYLRRSREEVGYVTVVVVSRDHSPGIESNPIVSRDQIGGGIYFVTVSYFISNLKACLQLQKEWLVGGELRGGF